MRTIYKYKINLFKGDHHKVVTRKGAVVRRVDRDTQIESDIGIWMEVDPDAEEEVREFVIVGTGFEVPENAHYIGSVLTRPYMWHIYENLGYEDGK